MQPRPAASHEGNRPFVIAGASSERCSDLPLRDRRDASASIGPALRANADPLVEVNGDSGRIVSDSTRWRHLWDREPER